MRIEEKGKKRCAHLPRRACGRPRSRDNHNAVLAHPLSFQCPSLTGLTRPTTPAISFSPGGPNHACAMIGRRPFVNQSQSRACMCDKELSTPNCRGTVRTKKTKTQMPKSSVSIVVSSPL